MTAEVVTEMPDLEAPKPAGHYWLGKPEDGIGLSLAYRPNWFHRLMMRWCLGLEWRDEQ